MSQTVYINYFDTINESKVKAFMALCASIIGQHNPSKLYILFSSNGGSVDAGIVLFNYLRALPVPLIMHNTGSIDSIANVVFLAADERFANPNATFLLHGINWNFSQGSSLSLTALQETLSRFKADEDRMSGIITNRTSIQREELSNLYQQGNSVGLPYAKEKGLIQDIREAKVEPGSPLISCNFTG